MPLPPLCDSHLIDEDGAVFVEKKLESNRFGGAWKLVKKPSSVCNRRIGMSLAPLGMSFHLLSLRYFT
jgi:hypothetical protein